MHVEDLLHFLLFARRIYSSFPRRRRRPPPPPPPPPPPLQTSFIRKTFNSKF